MTWKERRRSRTSRKMTGKSRDSGKRSRWKKRSKKQHQDSSTLLSMRIALLCSTSLVPSYLVRHITNSLSHRPYPPIFPLPHLSSSAAFLTSLLYAVEPLSCPPPSTYEIHRTIIVMHTCYLSRGVAAATRIAVGYVCLGRNRLNSGPVPPSLAASYLDLRYLTICQDAEI